MNALLATIILFLVILLFLPSIMRAYRRWKKRARKREMKKRRL